MSKKNKKEKERKQSIITRRNFLKVFGIGAAGIIFGSGLWRIYNSLRGRELDFLTKAKMEERLEET